MGSAGTLFLGSSLKERALLAFFRKLAFRPVRSPGTFQRSTEAARFNGRAVLEEKLNCHFPAQPL